MGLFGKTSRGHCGQYICLSGSAHPGLAVRFGSVRKHVGAKTGTDGVAFKAYLA